LSADILFCVGLIVVSGVFPDDTQALAGAVFNTAAQFGTSIGLALIGVVAERFTQESEYADKMSGPALEAGYKAGFWTAMGWMLLTCVLAIVGFRSVDKIGLKRD
jgi:MFS family permease